MDDPHTYSWNEMSNQSRPIIEYLTLVGPDNVTRGMLIESWEPSEDLKTWTLHVRKGVKWHNGETLTAEHIAWNIRRWSDSKTGSAILGLSTFSALSKETGETGANGKAMRSVPEGAIEVVDDQTLRLHLSKPVLSLPQDCGDYPCLVIHPSFTAPFSTNPIGTGPYTLAELKVGERCVLKRITKTTNGEDFTYWGGDVYLDEIHFLSYEQEAQALALASGTVDAIYELTSDQLELAKSLEGAQIGVTSTAGTICMRMQIDQKPFDDIRVRQAIVKAADNVKLNELVFPNGGTPADNHHVAPIHPEYFPLPPLVRGRRRREISVGRGWLRQRPGPFYRCRQHRRAVATSRLRGSARSARRGWHPPRGERAAFHEVLGSLDGHPVWRDLLGTPSPCDDGARPGLSYRRSLERDAFLESGFRRGARCGRGNGRCRGTPGEDGEGRADPA
jgi:peptide/nickel transport system substrate-binding protein